VRAIDAPGRGLSLRVGHDTAHDGDLELRARGGWDQQ
jgi:hypothetical protein